MKRLFLLIQNAFCFSKRASCGATPENTAAVKDTEEENFSVKKRIFLFIKKMKWILIGLLLLTIVAAVGFYTISSIKENRAEELKEQLYGNTFVAITDSKCKTVSFFDDGTIEQNTYSLAENHSIKEKEEPLVYTQAHPVSFFLWGGYYIGSFGDIYLDDEGNISAIGDFTPITEETRKIIENFNVRETNKVSLLSYAPSFNQYLQLFKSRGAYSYSRIYDNKMYFYEEDILSVKNGTFQYIGLSSRLNMDYVLLYLRQIPGAITSVSTLNRKWAKAEQEDFTMETQYAAFSEYGITQTFEENGITYERTVMTNGKTHKETTHIVIKISSDFEICKDDYPSYKTNQ